MSALEQITEIKKQVETLETFLSSNSFFRDADTLGQCDEDMEDMDNQNEVFAVHFNRNETCVQFYTNRHDGKIQGWTDGHAQENSVFFAPTETEAVINFLIECGYFNGHEGVAALEEATKTKSQA